jgi:hypothetical protein
MFQRKQECADSSLTGKLEKDTPNRNIQLFTKQTILVVNFGESLDQTKEIILARMLERTGK